MCNNNTNNNNKCMHYIRTTSVDDQRVNVFG